MTDTELAALTTLIAADTMMMAADNEDRARRGEASAWVSEMKWPERDALEKELKRRKLVTEND